MPFVPAIVGAVAGAASSAAAGATVGGVVSAVTGVVSAVTAVTSTVQTIKQVKDAAKAANPEEDGKGKTGVGADKPKTELDLASERLQRQSDDLKQQLEKADKPGKVANPDAVKKDNADKAVNTLADLVKSNNDVKVELGKEQQSLQAEKDGYTKEIASYKSSIEDSKSQVKAYEQQISQIEKSPLSKAERSAQVAGLKEQIKAEQTFQKEAPAYQKTLQDKIGNIDQSMGKINSATEKIQKADTDLRKQRTEFAKKHKIDLNDRPLFDDPKLAAKTPLASPEKLPPGTPQKTSLAGAQRQPFAVADDMSRAPGFAQAPDPSLARSMANPYAAQFPEGAYSMNSAPGTLTAANIAGSGTLPQAGPADAIPLEKPAPMPIKSPSPFHFGRF